jgi:hypothetical protein
MARYYEPGLCWWCATKRRRNLRTTTGFVMTIIATMLCLSPGRDAACSNEPPSFKKVLHECHGGGIVHDGPNNGAGTSSQSCVGLLCLAASSLWNTNSRTHSSIEGLKNNCSSCSNRTNNTIAIGDGNNTTNATAHAHVGPFANLRAQLDYSYHKRYSEERELIQDQILWRFLNQTTETETETPKADADPQSSSISSSNSNNNRTTDTWVVFTAGAMGAGKTHTLKLLDQQGLFPLRSFVTVDPDVSTS